MQDDAEQFGDTFIQLTRTSVGMLPQATKAFHPIEHIMRVSAVHAGTVVRRG